MSYRGKRRLLNILSGITVFLIVIMSFFLMVSLVFNIVYIKTYVRGYSMLPTLNSSVNTSSEDGDTVFINKYSKYSNNDIVVAKVDWWLDGSVIKRLIGTPGDQIEIRDLGSEYGLYVNNELFYTRENNDKTDTHFNDYINFINNDYEHIDTSNNIGTTTNGNKCIILQNDEYFLIGDNWEGSVDCLRNGPVSKSDIVGKVDIVIPTDENNSFQIIMKYMLKALFKK